MSGERGLPVKDELLIEQARPHEITVLLPHNVLWESPDLFGMCFAVSCPTAR